MPTSGPNPYPWRFSDWICLTYFLDVSDPKEPKAKTTPKLGLVILAVFQLGLACALGFNIYLTVATMKKVDENEHSQVV